MYGSGEPNATTQTIVVASELPAMLGMGTQKKRWTTDNWKNVFFTDETKLSVLGGYVNRKCWVQKGRKAPNVATLQGGGGCIMVWAAFCFSQVLPLHRIEGTLNRCKVHCSP